MDSCDCGLRSVPRRTYAFHPILCKAYYVAYPFGLLIAASLVEEGLSSGGYRPQAGFGLFAGFGWAASYWFCAKSITVNERTVQIRPLLGRRWVSERPRLVVKGLLPNARDPELPGVLVIIGGGLRPMVVVTGLFSDFAKMVSDLMPRLER